MKQKNDISDHKDQISGKNVKKKFPIWIIINASVILFSLSLVFIPEIRITHILKDLRLHALEYFELINVTEYSFKKKHSGGLVLLNVNKRNIDEKHMRELLQLKSKEKNLVAKTPSEVKTLLFLEEIPVFDLKYVGGILIHKAHEGDPLFELYQKSDESLDVYRIILKATLVDARTQKIIDTNSFPVTEKKLYPNKINSFTKQHDWYTVHNTEGGTVIFVYILFDKNNIPYGITSGTGKKKLPENLLVWIKSLYDAKKRSN